MGCLRRFDGLGSAFGVRANSGSARLNKQSKLGADVDIKALREKLSVSQVEFAKRFGFSLEAIQTWERGHTSPEGPAKVLLKMIDRRPDIVERVLVVGRRSSCRYHSFDKAGQHEVNLRMI